MEEVRNEGSIAGGKLEAVTAVTVVSDSDTAELLRTIESEVGTWLVTSVATRCAHYVGEVGTSSATVMMSYLHGPVTATTTVAVTVPGAGNEQALTNMLSAELRSFATTIVGAICRSFPHQPMPVVILMPTGTASDAFADDPDAVWNATGSDLFGFVFFPWPWRR